MLTTCGLINKYLSFKLICLGIDSVNVFWGVRTKFMQQIQLDSIAHMQGIHYMAHRTNRVMQALSKLNMN